MAEVLVAFLREFPEGLVAADIEGVLRNTGGCQNRFPEFEFADDLTLVEIHKDDGGGAGCRGCCPCCRAL